MVKGGKGGFCSAGVLVVVVVMSLLVGVMLLLSFKVVNLKVLAGFGSSCRHGGRVNILISLNDGLVL